MTKSKRTTPSTQDVSMNSSEIIGLIDDDFFRSAPDEASLWTGLDDLATRAILFWAKFLDLRMGEQGDGRKLAADEAAKDRLKKIVRAVSWVESRHGTGTGNHPDVDPMQCGNPDDVWWKQLSGTSERYDRFIGGPDAKNYDANELPQGVVEDGQGLGFPNEAKLSRLDDVKKGHRDRNFNRTMGFFWAVPHLVWKINALQRGKVYKCGDFSRENLIQGAVAYNGSGEEHYEENIKKALVLIGWNTMFMEEAALGHKGGVSSRSYNTVEDRLNLLQGAAAVMEGMYDHFVEESEVQKPGRSISRPMSLRVKVDDVELEATFSREERPCSQND